MLAARQSNYWWHRARRLLSVSLLRRYGLEGGCKWLDLGCGAGGNLCMLNGLRPTLVVGADVSPLALMLARDHAPHTPLVRLDINRGLPFAGNSFDVVTIFNVLYHDWIHDREAVLAEAARILRPGGLALFTEPAFPALAREMDKIGMARRRFHRAAFATLCRDAGFDVLFSSYFTSFGFPMLLALKIMRRLSALLGRSEKGQTADMRTLHPTLNEGLYAAAAIESRAIVRGISLPFGVTLICVAQRR
jgi:SAM-dependent methyltransferase